MRHIFTLHSKLNSLCIFQYVLPKTQLNKYPIVFDANIHLRIKSIASNYRFAAIHMSMQWEPTKSESGILIMNGVIPRFL